MKALLNPLSISAKRVSGILWKSAPIFVFLLGSSLAVSLQAQQADAGSLAVAAENQSFSADGNQLANISSTFGTASLPDALTPNAPSGPAAPTAPGSSSANGPANTAVITPTTLTFDDRFRLYVHSFVMPGNLVGPLLGAGISQAEDKPHEWGGGMSGFGLRFGSSYGRSVIGRSIQFGVSAVDHEDPRYHPSSDTGVWRRTRHAIAATFISQTTGGGSVPAFSRFAGAYGAGFIANAWEPSSQNGPGHALERGSTSLLSNIGWHILEEFWPDVHSALHHHRN